MRHFARPTVVVSECLGFSPVRYDGAIIHDPFVDKLRRYTQIIVVCPEVEIGLGVPRNPIKIVAIDGKRCLIQPATGRDLTKRMNRFADRFLRGLDEVDGFIMKSRSPSSGIKDVKVYSAPDKGRVIAKGPGFFGGRIMELFPGWAIEDEGRLLNFKIREHFLTRIFIFADYRQVRKSGRMAALVDFHARNKLALMSYNQKELRLLGKIVANHEKRDFGKLSMDYEAHLRRALLNPARIGANINTLLHAFGYFSKALSGREKKYFMSVMEKYKKGKFTLSVANAIVRAWVARFENEYLDQQTFFEPYPDELINLSDSGRGKEK